MDELSRWMRDAGIIFMMLSGLVSVISIMRTSTFLVKLVVIEVITNLLMAGIALWALLNNQPVFIDICLTTALIMFLGMVAYFQFILERSDDVC